MPQAIRAMMPVIIAQLVVTLKDTALGFIITYPELLYFARLLGSNAPLGSPLIPAALVAGAIYVTLCLLLSYTAYIVEKRLRSSPKSIVVAGGEAGVGVGRADARPTTDDRDHRGRPRHSGIDATPAARSSRDREGRGPHAVQSGSDRCDPATRRAGARVARR